MRNHPVTNARRAAQGTWDGTALTRVRPVDLPPAIAGSPLWLVAAAAFVFSALRSGGLRYLLASLLLMLLWFSGYALLRSRRRHQEIVLGHNAIAVRGWQGRMRVYRTDAVARVLVTHVLWGRPTPLLLVIGQSGTALARIWGAEWDATQLSQALNAAGIAVKADAGPPRSPAEFELLCHGSMSWPELHPIIVGFVSTFVLLVAVASLLVGVGIAH